MSFLIQALKYESFAHYFDLSDTELRAHRALIRTADKRPGFPCRVSLEDACLGERVLLIHHEHLPVESPYRASHAIYVRESAANKACGIDEVPELFRTRVLSLRAFDLDALIIDADVVVGAELERKLDSMLLNDAVAHIDIHFAKTGCFAARALHADS
jgi:hypothetical protein